MFNTVMEAVYCSLASQAGLNAACPPRHRLLSNVTAHSHYRKAGTAASLNAPEAWMQSDILTDEAADVVPPYAWAWRYLK